MATRRRTRRANRTSTLLPAILLGGLLGGLVVLAQVEYDIGIRDWGQATGLVLLAIAIAVASTALWKPRHAWRLLHWTWSRRRPRTAQAPPSPVATSRVPIPAGLRFAVLRRDGFRCAYCGRGETERVRLHIDHLIPVAHGGKNELDNLVTACQDCNLGKSATDLIGAN